MRYSLVHSCGVDDWNDLRFFLGVAEHGSTLAAARVLGSSQSTIFRRIAAVEAELGLVLFDRRASGYALTTDGEALLPVAREAEAAIARLEQVASGRKRGLAGRIRFSAPEIVLSFVLPTVIGKFRSLYPDVRIELVATDRAVDLEGGEADVALRAGAAPTDGALFGRRLVYDQTVLVASRTYVAAHGSPSAASELAHHAMIIPELGGIGTPFYDWTAAYVAEENIVLRPDTMVSALSGIVAGLGIGPLPNFVATRHPDLIPLSIDLPIARRELWIVTHERLRDSPSIRALMDFIAAYVAASAR